MQEWAVYTGGMMGRSPDYINVGIMAYGAAADMFGMQEAQYKENMIRYYEYCRENDLSLTHTLIQPQVNRGVSASKLNDPYIAARIKERTDDGVVHQRGQAFGNTGRHNR